MACQKVPSQCRAPNCHAPSGLHPSFAPIAFKPAPPRSVSGQLCACAPPFERSSRSTPGVLVPARVILSRSIITYSTPSAPLAGTSRFRRPAVYTGCLRCASLPRRPPSGSVLSLSIPSRLAVFYDRGEPIGCLCPVPSPMTLAFARSRAARHSQVPPSSASDGTRLTRLH